MHIDIVENIKVHMVYKEDNEYLRIDSENWFIGTQEHYKLMLDDDIICIEEDFQEYIKQWNKDL